MSRHFPKYVQKKPKKPPAGVQPDWRLLAEAHSPYLAANLQEYDDKVAPDVAFEKAMSRAGADLAAADDVEGVMAVLRRAKRSIATAAAVADLSGLWNDLEVMRQLSRFADLAVGACLRQLLLAAHKNGLMRLPDATAPEKDCGVIVIALGKWGAFELNYSSDIDLMVIFDPRKAPLRDREEAQNFFIRLTRDLARMLDQPTEDGYVFRTDLRLRPDPGAMPLAVSIDTAEMYYGSLGQNWERAAMIKSRPVAGDVTVGADFTNIMRSWIWRRNLDFAAIQDIHSIKRQINAKQAGKPRPAAKGNPFLNFNVKLGHGGIREIEFFAQTQQLIHGGRDPALRCPDTLSALAALAAAGYITAGVRDDLTNAYIFLRRTEHRLQMQDDRQTHTLPSAADAFAHFAAFMQLTPQKLAAELAAHTGAVKKVYAELFTESPSLAGPGNLVFTGVEDDPETLETLLSMGFREPAKITAAIRGWHHGRYRAVRSEKARQILTEITPHLLDTLSRTPHADDAFIRFDQFLSRLPSGVPIFSMFARNPQQMELVAEIMGTSPALAGHLGTHPEVLDGVLSKDFFGRLPELAHLKEELEWLVSAARGYEDILDLTRRWAREKRFHAGIHMLRGISDRRRCSLYLSDIAEAVILCLVPAVETEFAQQHGLIRKGEFILLAMGSLAAREMSVDSDLDLIGLYKAPEGAESDGQKPLPANVYYIRLMQRVIAALTAPTAEGVLYDADARLRPDGSKGPMASPVQAFFDYQRKNAWVWEHMSLIRSRPVYASPAAAKLITSECRKILSVPRDGEKLRRDMLDMRARIEKQFGSGDPWNLKYRRGGTVDVMFAVHFLILDNAAKYPDLLQPSVDDALAALLKRRLVAARDARALGKAHRFAQDVQGFLRLAAEMPFDPKKASPALQAALVRNAGGGRKKFGVFSKLLAQACRESHAAYRRILEGKRG